MKQLRGHHKIWLTGLVVLAAAAMLPVPWRTSRIDAAQAPDRPIAGAVRKAAAGERLGADPGRKGETYYAFEAGATRVTSRFADAIAVSERSFDGDLHTTLSDASATEIARLKFDRIDGVHDIVQYSPRSGAALQVFNDPTVRATLHGNARQAYSLWKDQVDGNHTLRWQDGLMRRAGAPARDIDRDTMEVQTEWSSGLTARTVRSAARSSALPGRTLGGEVLVTRLSRDGADVGIVNWFPESRVLIWHLPGLTKGYIAPEHLTTTAGSWPFTPDMEWLNIQIAAFHQFKTQIDKNGFVAQRQGSWPDRLLALLEPTLLANEPGCDGFHWLDGTVFRFCCDVHDLCYAKVGCTAQTWWQIWTSWRCDFCNTYAIACFMDGGANWDDRRITR